MNTVQLMAMALAACIAAIIFMVGRSLTTASVRYKANFQDAAQVNLAEMFLFIEPFKLFVFNIVLMLLVAGGVLLMGWGAVLATLSAAVVGASPPIIYKVMHSLRRRRIVAQLPDALMSIASNMRSGLSLVQALETTVTYEQPPLKHELDLMQRELKLGVDFNAATANLYSRVPEVEVQLIAAAMQVSREIGGNLAEALERISDTLRKRLQMEGKIRSLTAQGKLQGVVMVLLPVFMIFALRKLEPAAMEYLFHAWYGWATIVTIVTLEAIGYHFIQKIVNIDV